LNGGDILKSETCGLRIPEIDLELTPGTLGGRFTTVEGLLSQVQDELSERAPFVKGDSATEDAKSGLELFLEKLDKVIKMEITPVTLVLDDPLANSVCFLNSNLPKSHSQMFQTQYLQNLYAPDPDPNMTIEEYERTWDQNEAYGLNDIHVEDAVISDADD
jgi:zinc finger protein